MDRNEFANIYKELIYNTRIVKSSENDNIEMYLIIFMKRLVDYFNNYYKTDVKVKIIDKIPQLIQQKSAAQFNRSNGMIEFSPKTIREIIDEKKKDTFSESYFDNITFDLLLIDIAAHEFCHFLQHQENSRIVSEQNYLNALSPPIPNYYERSSEGEAFGFGVNMLYYFVNHDYLPKKDIELFKNKMNNKTFIHNNISNQLMNHWLCKIPFISYNNQYFEPIIKYVNNYIASLPKEKFNSIAGEFPLITIGISRPGKEKDADELVKQYIDKRIYFNNNNMGNINNEELSNLLDIYIYLLIPKLNQKTYEELINKYGVSRVNNIINSMIEKIEIKMEEYNEAYNESLYWFSRVVRKEELKANKIDIDYIYNKYSNSIKYLNESLNKLREIINNKSNISSRR